MLGCRRGHLGEVRIFRNYRCKKDYRVRYRQANLLVLFTCFHKFSTFGLNSRPVPFWWEVHSTNDIFAVFKTLCYDLQYLPCPLCKELGDLLHVLCVHFIHTLDFLAILINNGRRYLLDLEMLLWKVICSYIDAIGIGSSGEFLGIPIPISVSCIVIRT